MTTSAGETEAEAGIERIVLFSDAVIAIAITLLVLDIKLPELPEPSGSAALAAALVSIAPKIIAYVVSFLVVGQFWFGPAWNPGSGGKASWDRSWWRAFSFFPPLVRSSISGPEDGSGCCLFPPRSSGRDGTPERLSVCAPRPVEPRPRMPPTTIRRMRSPPARVRRARYRVRPAPSRPR